MPPIRTTPDPIREGRRAAPLPAEARRAEIVTAVLPLLLEQGEAVTTRELARAAGVSEGTLFNVFAGKDELIGAALETALDQGPFERAVRSIDPSLGLPEAVAAAIRLVQERIVDIWRLLSVLGPRHAAVDRPLPVSAALTELFERHAGELTIDAVDAARLLRALTLSLTHPTLTPEPAPAERIVDILLHGIRHHAERPIPVEETT